MIRTALPVGIALFCSLAAPGRAQSLRTGGLENWCLNMHVTAGTSASTDDGKYGAIRAVDGDLGTRWASSGPALPQWLQVDFDQPRTVDTVVITQSDDKNLYASLQRVELSFSAGDPVQATLEDGRGPQIVRFDARQTTSLRLTMLTVYEVKNYVGLRELAAFADPDGRVKPVQSPRQQWESIDLTGTGREVHPCVNKLPEDVERAKHNIETCAWARDYVKGVQSKADGWLARSDEWLLAQIPKGGACFAYGFTGCPICGASWGTWGGARCSFDNPGHVTCANGHVLPDADHPDPGTGYVDPDGRIHYSVGSYNAWVVETLQFDALRPLCLTYLLTGDERYAHKAAVILDGLAAVYPECDAGSWDYPSSPPSGRFCRPWYQVARVLVHYVDFYDELFNSPEMDQPSVVEGMTRRQNIEQNLLRNGGAYCYQQSLSGGLDNGHSDYIRGVLAVGCVLGIEDYVEWALNGPYGIYSIIANNADRDGRYYESSLGYALHARDLYLTYAEPLLHYRSARYPEGVNVYDDPKFLSFYFLPDALFDCAGHMPRYGDTGPDTALAWPEHPLFSQTDYTFAERMYTRTRGPQREPFAAALRYLAGSQGEAIRASSRDQMWMLFNAADFPGEADTGPIVSRLSHTDFFGQKGFAILRDGEGDEAQAALLRFGQALNHGHYDDLNLNYFAQGKEVTYDLGYSLGSTHTQVGWARQTASHNLVVVNETRQHTDGCGTGGDLLLLAEQPGLRLVEADAAAAYAGLGVDQYRRTLALIGESEDIYLVDLFRVHGGRQHDYMFHCAGDQVKVEGVQLGPVQPGSLAGPEYDWGHRQLNDGNMSGVPSTPYWNPPPGNGYGFLVDVRRGAADGSWTATWELDGGREALVRLHALPQPGTEVITADAPGIYPHFPRAAYVCARRTGEGLRSDFACVIETSAAARHRNVHRASRILAGAKASAGVIKLISAYDLVLFQAQAAGDRMTFPVTVPADGDYTVVVGHYLSPAYGQMRLLIDGEAVGELLGGTGSEVRPAEPAVLGTVHLSAGEHLAALEAVAPDGDGGRYWLGISFVALDPVQAQAAPAGPGITRVDRLTPDTGGEGIGVRVVRADGLTDYVFSAPDAAERAWGDMVVAARFARVRTAADGRLLAANLVGGSRLVACGVTVELPADAWRAKVVQVDDPAREVVLDAALPEGDVLAGQAIYFDNPGYSRDTAYHIERVTVASGRSRVRVREATFTLGKAVLDEAPLDDHTITTLVPHEYAKTLARANVPAELNFFHGKLLESADGGFAAIIQEVQSGQPMHIIMDQVTGLAAGDELYYRDVRRGDDALVHCCASLQEAGAGAYRVQSNTPVKLIGAAVIER